MLGIVLVVAALVVAFLLVDHTALGHQLFGDVAVAHQPRRPPPRPDLDGRYVQRRSPASTPRAAAPRARTTRQLPLAIDGNPATGWSTESYNDRHFGNLKPGSASGLTLAQAAKLAQLEVTSPTQGWAAVGLRVRRRPGPRPPWRAGATPVDQHESGIDGDATFDLHGRTGRHVLLWITDLGDGPPPVRAEIDELRLRS